MFEPIINKTCYVCKQTKPISEFYKHKLNKDGHSNKCKICKLKYVKEYRQTEKGRKVNLKAMQRYYQTKKGKKSNNQNSFRFRIRHPGRIKAKGAVQYAITIGKLPRLDSLQCHCCPAQAKQYHHLSYAPEHWLNVIPVCKQCHIKIHIIKKQIA